MAILHGKQGLICDKRNCYRLTDRQMDGPDSHIPQKCRLGCYKSSTLVSLHNLTSVDTFHRCINSSFCLINPFPSKPWFLCVCSMSLLKTLWEKEKLLIMSNFSFSHSVFYPSRELCTIFIKFEIVVCKPFEFGRV